MTLVNPGLVHYSLKYLPGLVQHFLVFMIWSNIHDCVSTALVCICIILAQFGLTFFGVLLLV